MKIRKLKRHTLYLYEDQVMECEKPHVQIKNKTRSASELIRKSIDKLLKKKV